MLILGAGGVLPGRGVSSRGAVEEGYPPEACSSVVA